MRKAMITTSGVRILTAFMVLAALIAGVLVPATPAYAAVETLRPNATGYLTDWTPYGETNNWECVDETSPDGDSTYVRATANFQCDLYNIQNSGAGAGTINSIKVYARVRLEQTGSFYFKIYIRTNGSGAQSDSKGPNTSYNTYNYQWNTNPITTNPWTWDEINDLQIGVKATSFLGGYNHRCTQVYVVVNYTPNPPTVTTQAVSDIGGTTATGNGTITATGGQNCTKRGVCWNTTGNPTVADDKSEETGSFGTGAFTRPMTGLTPGQHYYVKAYAYNSSGYGYGDQVEFYTQGPPVVTSSAATNVEETTATWNGNITSTGGVTVDYRGFVWGTTSKADPGNVAPADSGYDSYWVQSGSYGTGSFSHNVTGLTPGATWYYRACAHNTYGWDYSNVQQTVYTKPGDPADLTATPISSSQIDLTWTMGTGAEKTMIRRQIGSYPTGPSDGDQAYFDTGTSHPDTGLDQGQTYFYRAWAWDTNSGYSDGYSQASATTPVGDLYLKLWIQWEYDTTFHDLSGEGNDATPTFRTESSDPDISASFLNFRPIKEARCTVGLTEEGTEMLTTPPDQPPELYGEEGWGLEHLPGVELINTMLEAGKIPPDFFWIWFCYGMAALGVIGGYHFIRSSLLFPTLIGFVVILFFALTSGGDPIPLWTIIPYSAISAGLLVSERVFGW